VEVPVQKFGLDEPFVVVNDGLVEEVVEFKDEVDQQHVLVAVE
jgi:hypothetical protein